LVLALAPVLVMLPALMLVLVRGGMMPMRLRPWLLLPVLLPPFAAG
jgi:hypothetical protein